MTTTPPSSTTVMMPSTPRHGVMYDIDAHESPLRRSARLLNRKILRDTTPLGTNAPKLGHASQSPTLGDSKSHCSSRADSPIPSFPKSPSRNTFIRSSTKKFHSSHDMSRRPSQTLHTARHKSSIDISAEAPSNPNSNSHSNTALTHTTLTASMLPTPAKTPRKKKVTSNTGSAARVLFPPRATDTEMPPPKRMKSTGLDDLIPPSSRSRKQKTIDFFVDSRDQIPDVNKSENNPFIVHSDDDEEDDVYEEHFPASPSKKPQHIKPKSEKLCTSREPVVEENVHRQDGMLYTFRGKKIFRKFDDEDEESEEEDVEDELLNALSDELDEELDDAITNFKPLTRSSIKPRILFPTKQQQKKKQQETSTNNDNTTALRTPSPEPETSERPETPTCEEHSTPLHDEPETREQEKSPEPVLESAVDGEKPDADLPNEANMPETPGPATPSEQSPQATPQTPRTLRPRGIKAYLNPIASTKKQKSKLAKSEAETDAKQEQDQDLPPSSSQEAEPSTPTTRTLRSRVVEGGEDKSQEGKAAVVASTKKGRSPFDSWRRTKSSAPVSPMLSRLRKRTATNVPLEPVGDSAAQKKTRSK